MAKTPGPTASGLSDEIDALLASAPNEDALREVVVDALGSGYLPEAHGWTYRAWLTETATRVEHLLQADAPVASAFEESVHTAVRGPQRAGAAGSLGDHGRQLGLVGDGERHVCAAAAAGRSAVGLRREMPVREKPDIERGQGERLPASSVRPAENFPGS
jgi:hypothetical protein